MSIYVYVMKNYMHICIYIYTLVCLQAASKKNTSEFWKAMLSDDAENVLPNRWAMVNPSRHKALERHLKKI